MNAYWFKGWDLDGILPRFPMGVGIALALTLADTWDEVLGDTPASLELDAPIGGVRLA